jgi:hypothetical protein
MTKLCSDLSQNFRTFRNLRVLLVAMPSFRDEENQALIDKLIAPGRLQPFLKFYVNKNHPKGTCYSAYSGSAFLQAPRRYNSWWSVDHSVSSQGIPWVGSEYTELFNIQSIVLFYPFNYSLLLEIEHSKPQCLRVMTVISNLRRCGMHFT